MRDAHDDPAGQATAIDPRLAVKPLKAGLIPTDTGIYLRIEQGPDTGKVVNLSAGGVYVIGRETADIGLSDPKVSRKHAELGLYGPGAYVLRDLASSNGTRVNRRRVSDRCKLAHWDLIEVGDTTIRFAVVENALAPSSA